MDFSTSIDAVRKRIAAACARSGRDPHSVQLLAVSKGHPAERVDAMAAQGVFLFGESRVQEAKAKIPLCAGKLRWHMIGHLQSNKCRDAVPLFDMIQSIDSLALAGEVDKWANHLAKTIPVLLEVNLAGEATKFGYDRHCLLSDLPELNALPRIELHGLMTIAPWTPNPEKVRAVFRQLRELKAECEQRLGAPLPELSMGMSGDFEVAIEEQSTLVRIGTALFGPRVTKPRQSPEP